MGFRFWRRIRIAPGLTLNLSKSGASLSFGGRGARFTVGPRGRRATLGLPGTGLFYTQTFSSGRSRRRGGAPAASPPLPRVRPEDRLTLGFFKRLVTPKEEEAFVDGCRELVRGDEEKALEHLREAVHLADGAYLAGFLALKQDRLDEAAACLEKAVADFRKLGRYFNKYGLSVRLDLPVTEELVAHAGVGLRGALLALAEVYQRQGRREAAIASLERLRRLDPDDPVVKVSLAELLLEARPQAPGVCRRVVRLAEGAGNETPVHAALLLYKAKALRRLGLPEAARNVLTGALRRRKGLSEELLRALRYERALAYEDLGMRRRARTELERLYAEDPRYEDVAARLGL
ncbi:MAG: DUF4236 domain-containing protein [Verrucomicrobia bacterium]|nr:DUF4236 domain-containing protein [Verrucomicrobiota bacterium]